MELDLFYKMIKVIELILTKLLKGKAVNIILVTLCIHKLYIFLFH